MAFANDDFENARRVKYYWEIVADNLKKRGWSLGWVSALDSKGRTIWIVDAHRGHGKRFVVRADELLTAFLELERITRGSLRPQMPNRRKIPWKTGKRSQTK